MFTKIDYAIGGLIGFFVGIFAIPTLINLDLHTKIAAQFSIPVGLFLSLMPWIMAIIYFIFIWIGEWLSKKMPIFIQLTKFGAVGVLNTVIDFGVLNIISLITGVTGGLVIGGVNIPGVALALTNAYFLNKFWVFKHRDNKGALHDLPTFLLVSGLGIVINSSIVIFATSYPVVSFDAKTWLNIAKLCATVFSFMWNFLGYKFIVFKSSGSMPEEMPRAPIAPL